MIKKVPKYIRKKMNKVICLNNAANREMVEIELWLEDRGVDASCLNMLQSDNSSAINELCERIEGLL